MIAPLLALLAALPAGAELRVGAASVVITPPKGAPMAGYYHNRGVAGVHDDLHAKALVIESGAVKVALVACDLIGMPREIALEARRLITQATGILSGNVMISATHAHTGPVVAGDYAASLPPRVAEAVRLAVVALQPARIRAGVGQEASLPFNRRFHMNDGSVGWNPGKLNPNIVRPAGPVDPDVPVVYFDTPDNKPIAAYVNYALHLDTVGGEDISADFPYTLSQLLSNARGSGLTTLFTIGCAGNINHIDVSTRERQQGHTEAARIGTILAAAALKALKSADVVEPGRLRQRAEVVKLPLAKHDAEVAWARGVAAKFGERNAAPFLDLVRAARIVEVEQRRGEPIDVEVQVIALGDQLAWVGLPGEIFVELGQAIKRSSPFRQTVIAELANGSIGYVPDRKAHAQGAYEAISARCASGSGEMLVEAASRLLIDLFEEARATDRRF